MSKNLLKRAFGLLALPMVASVLAIGQPAGAEEDLGLTFKPQLNIGDGSRCESSSGSWDFGWLSIPVSLTGNPSSTVKVNYATGNWSAVQPGDYTAKTGTLTFEPSQATKKYINVPIQPDSWVEANEFFTVTLSGLSGPAYYGDKVGIGTILDDDPMKIHVSDAAADEGQPLSFKVTRCGSVANPAGVKYATSNGTAIAGSDYVANQGSVSFATNERVKTVSVATSHGWEAEANETMKLTLSLPTGVNLGDKVGVGTIRDAPQPA